MFIGESPGFADEELGRPFMSESGQLLHKVLAKLGVSHSSCYFTNVVTCRSCEAVMNDKGLPLIRRKQPVYRDLAPLPPHIEACLPRLHEEIYIVDPVIIVALGATAAKAVTGGNLSIMGERGKERFIEIPGASKRAVFTDKKRSWVHKVRGELITPTETNTVSYLLIPTLHPNHAYSQQEDLSRESPLKLIIKDLRFAVKVYERYRLEVFGTLPTGASDVSEESIEEEVGDNDGN